MTRRFEPLPTKKNVVTKESRKKSYFFSGHSGLVDKRTFFSDFDNFWTKRGIFLGKYFKKPIKVCEFSHRQLIHNTLIHLNNINIWICRHKHNI